MDPGEQRKRYATLKLAKRIRGTCADLTFKYGAFEEIASGTNFQFVYSFGGFSGRPIQTPAEGFAWFKTAGPSPFYWEVRKQDLKGNYSEVAAAP